MNVKDDQKSTLPPLQREGIVTQTVPVPKTPPLTLSQISGHRDRMTYVFQQEGNVGCVHFDAFQREIYLNGHNARTVELTKKDWDILGEFQAKLRHDPRFRSTAYQVALHQLKHEKRPNLVEIEEQTEVIEEEPAEDHRKQVPPRHRAQIRAEIIEALTRSIAELDPKRPYQAMEIAKRAYETYARLVTTPTKARFSTFRTYVSGDKRTPPVIKKLLSERGIQISYQVNARQRNEAFIKAVEQLHSQREYSWYEIAKKAYGIYRTSVTGKKLSLDSFVICVGEHHRLLLLQKLIDEKGIKIRLATH